MKNNLYAHICFSVILAIIAIIFSIVALCNTCPRLISEDEPGFDYIGVVVGVLSLLVALLIGWNIYNALDLNKRIKHIEEENIRIINNTENALVDVQIRVNDALNKLDRNRIQTEEYCMGIVDFLQGFTLLREDDRYMLAYRNFVSSILHFTRCNSQVRLNIDSSLNNMEVCLNEAKQSDYRNIGELIGFENAVNEIIQSNSSEFAASQRERFVLLENKRKRGIHENHL